MSQQNESAVRRIYELAWNQNRLEVLDECLAPNYTDHEAPPPLRTGIEASKQLITMYRSVFADNEWHIEDIFSAGDRVAVRVTVRAVHRGPYFGIEPTGKPVVMRGIDLFRVVDGKVTDHWGATNVEDVMNIVRGRAD